MSNRVLIIAEAGVNHNGDMNLAEKLIDAAAHAGADFVKFQTFNAQLLVTRDAPSAKYQELTMRQAQSQREMLRLLELTSEMHNHLIQYCKRRNIRFLSTAFDNESLDYLSTLELERCKVPSGEITNLPYLRKIGSFKKPIILSTGMATLSEIESAIDIFEQEGCQRNQITVMHCSTEYPTSMIDVNLKAMCTIKNAFNTQVGYSDHTLGIEVPVAAVALGAVAIEKHLTLDRKLPGPDHAASLNPQEFTDMVRAVRNIESALGDGIKKPSRSEIMNRSSVRKSLVAARPIRAGEIFTAENITAKRPGTGISPMNWDQIIGRTARRNYMVDDFIEL